MKTRKATAERRKFDSSTEQLDFNGNTIPIPRNFRWFQEENDLFIVNQEDGSIFKWIQVIGNLRKNGLTEGIKTEYGRRNFDGIFESKFNDNYFHETCDHKFKECIKRYGGFYISVYKARYEKDERITYAGIGILVNSIKYDNAKKIATNYMLKYRASNNYTTDLPCGAAMDCIYEYAFEMLEKEVLKKMLPGERKADAWNRISKAKRYEEIGVYGIQDLLTGEAELTTETYASEKCHVAVRNGTRGLFTICNDDYEKQMFETGEAIYFELGCRNFISRDAAFFGYGFRLMLLPV